MRDRRKNSKQRQLFQDDLLEQLNPKDPLLLLAKRIPWDFLERELAPLYSEEGRPAKPIRLMCGLLILKQMENLSDEHLVEQWVRNPYFQAFCGERTFQWQPPCASSDLPHFRKRVGDKGIEKIFQASVEIHGKSVLEKEVLIDTTVQEKNITFPTDSKLLAKLVSWCWKMGAVCGTKWRRSFRREMKEVIRTINFCRGPKNARKVAKARRRLKTIAGALFRELQRKLPEGVRGLEKVKEKLEIFGRILKQKRTDKKKVYSPHEPETLCIAKGKSHKKYEFGSKVCFVVGKNRGVILGALNFNENLYDGDTVHGTLEQMQRILSYKPKLGIAGKGFRGRNEVLGMKILTPVNQGTKTSETEKRRNRKRNKRRSAIEPVIGHLKSDFRMARNFLKGTVGNKINALMAAAAFNFKKWMRLKRLCSLFTSLRIFVGIHSLQTQRTRYTGTFSAGF